VEHEIIFFFLSWTVGKLSTTKFINKRKNIYKGRPKYLHVPNYTRDSIHDVNFWRWGPFTLYLVRVISEMNPDFHEIFIFIFMLLILYQYWSSLSEKNQYWSWWWVVMVPLLSHYPPTKLTSQSVQLSLQDFPILFKRLQNMSYLQFCYFISCFGSSSNSNFLILWVWVCVDTNVPHSWIYFVGPILT
jgi:hypothetical protein